MKKIGIHNYSKHYLLDLLPLVSSNDNLTYIATAAEAASMEKWIRMLMNLLPSQPLVAQNIHLRAEQLLKHGGALLSLNSVYTPATETAPTGLVFLDLNYSSTKEVKFAISGIDVTDIVSKSDKYTGLLTRFLKELYRNHEQTFGENTGNSFIQELFIIDDVDMVVDENNQFKIKVDRSLRDYLIALNTRLRVNA